MLQYVLAVCTAHAECSAHTISSFWFTFIHLFLSPCRRKDSLSTEFNDFFFLVSLQILHYSNHSGLHRIVVDGGYQTAVRARCGYAV